MMFEEPLPSAKIPEASVLKIAEGLRGRAQRAQRDALAAFALTALVVGGGAVGFYLAGTWVKEDTEVEVKELEDKVAATIATSTKSIDGIGSTLAKLDESAADLRSKAALAAKSHDAAPHVPPGVTEAEKNVEVVLENKARAQESLARAEKRIDSASEALQRAKAGLTQEFANYRAALKLPRGAGDDAILEQAKLNTAGDGAALVTASRAAAEAAERIEAAKAEREKAALTLTSAETAIHDTSEQLLKSRAKQRESLGTALREYAAATEVKGRLVTVLEARADGLAQLRAGVAELREEVNGVSETLKTQIDDLKNPVQPVDGLYLWGSALLTRSAVALFTFFAAQMLLGLYRYNMRLAGHLHARADALSLATPDSFGSQRQEYLHAFIESMSPDRVDFGRAPMNPAEKVLELAKDFAVGVGKARP